MAAVVVVVWHATALFGFSPASGYLAVDLFFCLSGFVLAHAYDARIDAGLSTAGFMQVRLIRLYPLYILSIVIMASALSAALIIGAKTNWTAGRLASTLAFNMAFIPAPQVLGGSELYPLNVPAWSLGLELAVNLAFVAVWRMLRSPIRLRVLVTGAMVGLFVIALHRGDLNVGAQWSSLTGGLARVVYSFFIGVMLRRWSYENRSIGIAIPSAVTIGVILPVLWLPVATAWRPLFDLVTVVVLFPLLVLLAAAQEPGVMLSRIFPVLGRASYAVYVLHVPLLAIVLGLLPAFLPRHHLPVGPLTGGLFILSVLVAALLADRLYDTPLRRWAAGTRWCRNPARR